MHMERAQLSSVALEIWMPQTEKFQYISRESIFNGMGSFFVTKGKSGEEQFKNDNTRYKMKTINTQMHVENVEQNA